jgi:hypothetical protein
MIDLSPVISDGQKEKLETPLDQEMESELWVMLANSVSPSPSNGIQVTVNLFSADRTAKIADRPHVAFRVYDEAYRHDEVLISYLVRPIGEPIVDSLQFEDKISGFREQ